MKMYSDKFRAAAKAAGMTPEKFAIQVRGLLSASKCSYTRKPIFDLSVRKAISRA